MALVHMLRLTCLIFMVFLLSTYCSDVKKFPMLMPNVYPFRDELYLCTPVRIVDEKSFYIVGFEPKANMSSIHHILLFGCSSPGSEEQFWDCGEMAEEDPSSNLRRALPCELGSHVLYAWARNAKTLSLPEDVGFQVGAGTKIQYLVMQVHYSHKFPENTVDNSGLQLWYTKERQSKLAGVLLLGVTGAAIPGNAVTNLESSCQILEDKVLHPFAYRTHTHSLGKVVSGYRVRRNREGRDHWTELGKRDPLTPQMFYPVFSKDPIRKGDVVASRCTMDSRNRNRVTNIGPTNADEMCNFYLMYYVEDDVPLEVNFCSNQGLPYQYWSMGRDQLNNIPDKEASRLY